jgi:phospholipase C
MKKRLHPLSRRDFIRLSAAAGGATVLGGAGAAYAAKPVAGPIKSLPSSTPAPTLPAPSLSGIQHVVVVMMENRSFDHFLGWLPGANGKQAGQTFLDSSGVPHISSPLSLNYQGCGFTDPNHSYEGGRVEYNGSITSTNSPCNGFRFAGANPDDDFSIGYYVQGDLPFLGQAAPAWTVGDNYFAGIMAETYPNRFHMHAAQTDRLHNTTNISTVPTIWDNLASHGLSGRYYYSDVPFLALWGTKYLSISHPFQQFIVDAAAGELPSVSYIDPRFEDESSGTSGDDHPHADIRNGEAFLNQIYNAVTTSPNWPSTVLIINYDEWGGFSDHVPPPLAPIPPATQIASMSTSTDGTGFLPPLSATLDGRLGFRTPNLIISPWSRRGAINSTQFDHTSILNMIAWRWNLPFLTVRDQTANNIALALDFSDAKNLRFPTFVVPAGPDPDLTYPTPCMLEEAESAEEWDELKTLAVSLGFPIF